MKIFFDIKKMYFRFKIESFNYILNIQNLYNKIYVYVYGRKFSKYINKKKK